MVTLNAELKFLQDVVIKQMEKILDEKFFVGKNINHYNVFNLIST